MSLYYDIDREQKNKRNFTVIRILVCDDDARFARDLASNLNSLRKVYSQEHEIEIAVVSNPHQLTNDDILRTDIAFLDIDMGDMNGINVAQKFRELKKDTVIVFVTSYLEYAPEGYEVGAFRYLLKSQIEQKLPICFEKSLDSCLHKREYLTITCDKELTTILPSHLVYVETYQRNLLLHMLDSPRTTLRTHMTMNALENMLDNKGFLRIHQSYLVNMAYIVQIKSTGTILSTGVRLPTSARNYASLKQQYLLWKGQSKWNMF